MAEQLKTIYVIRHGEANGNEHDASLTDRGKEQAQRLVSFFSQMTEVAIDRLISSPFLRAKQTAAPLAELLELEVNCDRRLEELNIGNVPPDVVNLWGKLKEHFENKELKFPQGESFRELQIRVLEFLDDQRKSDQHVLMVVTHRFPMALLLNHFDPNFDFDHAEALTNPDVFTIKVASGVVDVKRIWENTT